MQPGTVVNVHTEVATFKIATMAGLPPIKYRLKPGETVEIAEGYTKRPPAAPGAAQALSTIELLTNGRVIPADDPRAAPFVPREPEMSLDQPVSAPRGRKG